MLCDAGVGRERAGIGGLDYLDAARRRGGGHRSPLGAHRRWRGLLRARADLLRQCPRRQDGVAPGMTARDALERLDARRPAALAHARRRCRRRGTQISEAGRRARARARLQRAGDAGGCRPHRRDRLAWRAARRQARDRAQIRRVRGASTTTPVSAWTMPAFRACRRSTRAASRAPRVSAWSARIGDARSTYEDGIITAVNARAAALRRRNRHLGERTGGAPRRARA